jgi:hypothetical protein
MLPLISGPDVVAEMYERTMPGGSKLSPVAKIGADRRLSPDFFVRRLRDGQAKLTLSTEPLCPQ